MVNIVGLYKQSIAVCGCYASAFSPMIDIISVVMKNSRNVVVGSLKKIMPTSAVPTAPMLVHTGYAVPLGSVSVSFASSAILSSDMTMKPPVHSHHSVPAAFLALPSQKVKSISHSTAIICVIQFFVCRMFVYVSKAKLRTNKCVAK